MGLSVELQASPGCRQATLRCPLSLPGCPECCSPETAPVLASTAALCH